MKSSPKNTETALNKKGGVPANIYINSANMVNFNLTDAEERGRLSLTILRWMSKQTNMIMRQLIKDNGEDTSSERFIRILSQNTFLERSSEFAGQLCNTGCPARGFKYLRMQRKLSLL